MDVATPSFFKKEGEFGQSPRSYNFSINSKSASIRSWNVFVKLVSSLVQYSRVCGEGSWAYLERRRVTSRAKPSWGKAWLLFRIFSAWVVVRVIFGLRGLFVGCIMSHFVWDCQLL